jgi:cation transport regulator ChaC
VFKKSFGNVLKRKAKLPYVTSIDFHALKTKEKVIEGVPVVCTQCGGILTKASLVKTSPELGRHWNCEFCGTLNVIEGDFVIPEGDDVEWIIEKKPEDDIEVGTKIGVGTKEHIVAVIDVSGSMSDGKLEAVKHSLIQSLKDLKMNTPYSRFTLIAFSTEVFLFNANGEKVLVLEGDVLHSIKGIEKAFNKTKLDFAPISDTAEKWINTVSQLRPLNYTALGPAFLGGITLLGRISGGGRLILLTDGLANEGLGNLESSATGKKFYQECAVKCMEKSVTVEVIGVAPEDDSSKLALDVLGRLADSTGGEIFYITASEVQKAFEELRKREYLARDVNIKVVTDTTFKLKSVTGAGVPAVPAPKEPVKMGAVTEDREVFFELETAEEEVKKEEVPMQAQVTYIDSEGNKRLRVLTSRAAVVEEEVEFNKAYDARVVTTNVVQAAGESYYEGKAEDAKKRLNILKETLAREDGIQFQEEALNVLDIQEREIDEEEAELADKAAAPSARAAKGLKRKRTSEEDLF